MINITTKFPFLKGKKKESEKKYDPDFIYKIQPAGGIIFKENYVKTGSSFETCIEIYDFPTHVEDFWLYSILNMDGVITSIDIAPTDKVEVVHNINKSLTEQLERLCNDKDQTEKLSANNRLSEMTQIYNQISNAGEVIKNISIRIYVTAYTEKKLQEKVGKVLDTIIGLSYKGAVFLNETEFEYSALFNSNSVVSKFPNKRIGKPVPAKTLAGGYPFHFTKLNDPDGTYLGATDTGGNVIFDLFHKDSKRKYYNGLCIGTMGSGKSTTLKKLFLNNAIVGNMIRCIDVTGEFEETTRRLGGKIIRLDGTNGIINLLQILKTSEQEKVSFMQHLSKITTFYKFLSPDAKDETCKEFELLVRKLYIEKSIYDHKLSERELHLTDLPKEKYPIFSDLLELTQSELYTDVEKGIVKESISDSRSRRLESIELTLKSLVNNYGHLFNGTSSIEDVTKEQIVSFSIRNLTKMSKEIFNAQMFNILNILWDGMMNNGTKYKALFDDNKIKWEDIVRYLIIIDEAHNVINPQNLLAVKYLTNFEREARKYFAGLMFASPSIHSFVPEGTSSEAANDIKTLFELTQYKFIMQQDSDALKTLRSVFEGSLSSTEIAKIPNLGQGDCVLSINSWGNISFKIEASPKELNMFKGGA
ncbi:MAG: ATP-binding protein [Clostridium sp.]|nr:ATP-binding protein [Clostridium sp.]